MSDFNLNRKAILLLGEVLKLANDSLPSNASAKLQVLPALLEPVIQPETEDEFFDVGMIYQIDSVNRTLQRSGAQSKMQLLSSARNQELGPSTRPTDIPKPRLNVDMDELQFRSLLLETQVLTTVNYLKWRWDLISDLIEGPLLNPKRLEEGIKNSKFLKRLMGFYQPFKYRFSDARNTKPNQRYVRIGCALIKVLLQNTEGIVYLSESKLLKQLAECLAQLNRVCIFLAMFLAVSSYLQHWSTLPFIKILVIVLS